MNPHFLSMFPIRLPAHSKLPYSPFLFRKRMGKKHSQNRNVDLCREINFFPGKMMCNINIKFTMMGRQVVMYLTDNEGLYRHKFEIMVTTTKVFYEVIEVE